MAKPQPFLKSDISTELSIDLRSRYDRCKSERTTVEQMFEEIERYIMPYRGMFFKDERSENTIEWRKRRIYDTTAPDDAKILAHSIDSALTSFTSRWFSINIRGQALRNNAEVKRWSQESSDIVFAGLAESDFPVEIGETYLDIVGFGTAFVTEEEDMYNETFQGLDFQSTPIKHAFFEEDAKGKVLYFFRRKMWTPTQIVDKFGKENVPVHILEKATGTSAGDKIECVYAVFPRTNYRVPPTMNMSPAQRPWGGLYFLYEDGAVLGSEDDYGYYEMPTFVPRYMKVNDSKWGFGPGHIVLSNIITLNDIIENVLLNLGKQVDPPFFATARGLLSDLDLEASGLTIVRSKDDVWQHQDTARMDLAGLEISDLRAAIHRAYMVDRLELKESPAMSATEVNARVELMQRLLGPTLGRLKYDLFDPMIQRTYNIFHRNGMLPDLPQVMIDANAEIDIEYLGPLAKAQRGTQAAAIMEWTGWVASIAELNPRIVKVPNWSKVIATVGDIKGVPAELIRDTREVDSEGEKQEAQAEQANEIAMAEQEGNAEQAVAEGQLALAGGTDVGSQQ